MLAAASRRWAIPLSFLATSRESPFGGSSSNAGRCGCSGLGCCSPYFLWRTRSTFGERPRPCVTARRLTRSGGLEGVVIYFFLLCWLEPDLCTNPPFLCWGLYRGA